jgi:hypothetical protein
MPDPTMRTTQSLEDADDNVSSVSALLLAFSGLSAESSLADTLADDIGVGSFVY